MFLVLLRVGRVGWEAKAGMGKCQAQWLTRKWQ